MEMEVEGIGVLRNWVGPGINPHRDVRFAPPKQRPLPQPMTPEQLEAVRQRTTPPVPA